MASLSSPESRIKAAAQPGIKNQARCAGRNQESRISRGGQKAGFRAWIPACRRFAEEEKRLRFRCKAARTVL